MSDDSDHRRQLGIGRVRPRRVATRLARGLTGAAGKFWQAAAKAGEALVLPGDVTDLAAVEGAVAGLRSIAAGLDVLFQQCRDLYAARPIDEMPRRLATPSPST